MDRDRRLRWATLTAAAWFLALADPADARKFQMSGTWLVREGQVFVPLQFAAATPPSLPPPAVWASMGLFTEAPFTPTGQVVSDARGVSAEGSAPATLRIPEHRFVRSHDATLPLSGFRLIQITTMLAIDAPYETATLMAGAGPGGFTWCPANPACTAGGPVPGPGTQRGRIVYAAGANQFGGTMQMGLRGGGLVSLPMGGGLVGHPPFFGDGSELRRLAVGGGANDAPSAAVESLEPGYITLPTIFPPMGSLIHHPGPFATTMGGNTATMPAGIKLRFPTIGMGAGQLTTRRGFPHTTGTVLVQQTQYGIDSFFAVMGSDARTPLGAGNIALVAGGLTRRTTLTGSTSHGTFHRVSMSLAAPVPSLSPAGAAAAGALLLLAVGYALRRRIA